MDIPVSQCRQGDMVLAWGATHMPKSGASFANHGRLVAALDVLADQLAARPDQFGPAEPPTSLANEIGTMIDLVQHAKAGLQDQHGAAANIGVDDLIRAIDRLAVQRIESSAFPAALKLDEYALSIRREQFDGADPEIAIAERNLARDYFHLGDYASAARLAEEALSIMIECLGDADPQLLPFLDGLAGAYEQLGLHEEARSHSKRALVLAEASFGTADYRIVPALQTLESVWRAVGKFQEAHIAAERALDIQRSTFGEESFEAARALGRLAGIVGQIGERCRARKMIENALEILRRLHPVRKITVEIATLLTNLAGLADSDRALALYEEALVLRRTISGAQHPETVRVLSHLGVLHCQRGDNPRALTIWEQCLDLRRRTLGGAHPDVARSLIDVAYLLRALGETRRATRTLLEALAILGCYDMPAVTARANMLLASIVGARSLAAAILFGKLAVNALQGLRSETAALGEGMDRAFVRSREQAYRQLGGALIMGGRLPEAQQALAMLKEAELFEITLGDMDRRVSRASLTPLEALWVERADHIRARVRSRITELTRVQNDDCSRDDPCARLSQALEQSIAELEQWFESVTVDFKRTESRPKEGHATVTIDSTLVDHNTVPAGTALVQYLLASDHLRIILTTSGLLRHYDIGFSQGEVHRLVYAMRTALQEGSSEFFASARKLYDILIAPVAADLSAANVGTLALSLDGVLRYLPIAALHDGTRYVLENFALVLAAGGPAGQPVGRPSSDLCATGLGVTRAIGPHSALLGVREELMAVIRTHGNDSGILPGIIRLDEAFTADALHEALSAGYSVIHVSSHFAFRAAQEASSYLLLGDGSQLTIADLARLSFRGVELMVFSACDTATGGGHGQSGREVEGLGALARHLGARHVLATLWPVRDFTTAAVMLRFYRNWCEQELELPEALRRAQLSLLGAGDGGLPAGATRAIIDPDDGESAGRWDHPRYWAPYLLMGSPFAVAHPA